MMKMICRPVLLIAVTAWMLVAQIATAPAADAGAASAPLQAVLDRVHAHAGQEAWKETGFKDELIEAWLDKIVSLISTAGSLSKLKLPVRFADVKPADSEHGRAFSKALLVGKDLDLKGARLRNSLVLADGNVNVESAESSVIIARGAVIAARTSASVIVSGIYVKIAADGQAAVRGENAKGSLVVSRGWANVERIDETVLATKEDALVGMMMTGGIFVNATLVLGSSSVYTGERRPKSVKVRDLPLEDLPDHPLSKRLAFVGIVYPEALDSSRSARLLMAMAGRETAPPQPTGLVFRLDGKRYSAELNKPILNQAETPVSELADWKLSYLDNDLALFSSSGADVPLRIESR